MPITGNSGTVVQCDFDGTVTYKDVGLKSLEVFADGDWKEKQREVQNFLEFHLNKKFKCGGNSFNSCFIFEEEELSCGLQRIFKVYNKFNKLLLAKSAQSGIGMNT